MSDRKFDNWNPILREGCQIKKINMEKKLKMDYPLEGSLTFTQEI